MPCLKYYCNIQVNLSPKAEVYQYITVCGAKKLGRFSRRAAIFSSAYPKNIHVSELR